VRVLLLIFILALAGCASAPQSRAQQPQPVASTGASNGAADRAASNAAKMVGKPYRYGGSSPAGFDCSGLVQYSYRQAGIALPHNTDQQRSVSRAVKVADLRRGDLLFFNQEGKKYGHVGIYIGDGKFVHAPSSGKAVRSDRLDFPYWKKHLSEARRLAI
jgi:murein DD-endopeptidase